MPDAPDGDAASSADTVDGDRTDPSGAGDESAAFDLRETVARATFDPGANLLVTGPPTVPKRPLLTRLLTAGRRDSGGVVAATTEGRTAQLFEALTAAGSPSSRTALVACGAGGATPADASLFHRVDEQGDFSGIGVGVSKCLAGVEHEGATTVRVGFESLSTLLRARSREDVVKFCRLTTDRLAAQDCLGVFVADEAHDAATLGMLEHAFDARIQVRPADDGLEARVLGPPRVVADWAPTGDD